LTALNPPLPTFVAKVGLETVSTRKTRLEREFDPQVVRHLKAQLPHDVAVGGPTLAAHAIRAGIVDEYHLFVAPIIMGGGKPVLPGNVRVTLELLDERGFDNGMVYCDLNRKMAATATLCFRFLI
jgi:riboflavin biosynthesis pyrimidine reductase